MKGLLKTLVVGWASAFVLVALQSPAAVFTEHLDFSAAQSLWGDGSAASFQAAGATGGAIGIRYDVGASTGTVSSAFNGVLTADYTETLSSPGTTAISLGFSGDGGGGRLTSDLGAWLQVDAFVDIDAPWFLPDIHADWTLLDYDYAFNIDETFTPALPGSVMGCDAIDLADVGIGISPLQAGIDVDINENLSLDINTMDGCMVSKSRQSGTTRLTPFTINSGASVMVSANLSEPGLWDLAFVDLSIINSLSVAFDLTLTPYLDYVLGTWSDTLADINLYNNAFALDFNQLNTCGFTIEVAPIPDPMLLLGTGLAGLSVIARRKTTRASQ